jgi:gamma-glutamylcyclotransferase
MTDKKHYFAYGSNMNSERLRKRIGYLPPSRKALLQDYALLFNKTNYKNPTEGFANIVPQTGSQVEGILYEMTDKDIAKLDQFEGVPTHYIRQAINVECEGKITNALTYIAVTVKEGLKPSPEYLNHLLAGKAYLSEAYYQQLANTACL